jgi:hypothetical protein
MSDLPEKIQSATQDLHELRREIQSPRPATGPRFAEVDSAELKQFKAALDYVRQLVWTYIQADSRTQGHNLDEEVRSLRLQHLTEMPQTIQQEVKVRQLTPNSAAVSFLKAVHEIADAAFERHVNSDSDVEQAS